MSRVQTLDRPLGQLSCVDDLRPLHLALLREWNDLDDATKRERAQEFRRLAADTGRWIKSLEERDSVQTMIDYWSVTMPGIPGETFPDPVLLAEFSEQTVKKSSRRSPYVGLNAFEIDDVAHYFGRELDVDAVIAAFDRNAAAVIAGPSGMGKTSLAQAGVAGRLVAQPGEWLFFGGLPPGRDPVGVLLRAVRPPNADRNWIDEQRTALASAPDKFRELAEARLANPQQRLLILIDRAEELFASDVVSSEIAVAANAIAALIAGPTLGPHRILFTIREDFLPQLRTLINSTGNTIEDSAYHELSPPSYETLRDAIVKPGEVEGFRFDDQVVEDLAKETLDHPDALPLLEFTLTQLWKRAEIDRVSWSDYQQLPKPSQLLSDIAERTYADLGSEEAREVARITFLQMIRLGQDVTLRQMRRDDLERCLDEHSLDKSNLRPVLDGFVGAGLIIKIPGDNLPDDRFEISHSAVIRHWPRLLIWIQDERRSEGSRGRYMAALERWRGNDRSNRYLLPLWWLVEAGRYRGKSRALDEYIIASRRWWTWLGVLVFCLAALFLVKVISQGLLLRTQEAEIKDAEKAQIVATSKARDEGAVGADFSRRALIGDQTLLRLNEDGLLPSDQLPDVFLDRLNLRPSILPSDVKGYDPQFLANDHSARVPLPEPKGRASGIHTLIYPHTTVIYDTIRKVPLVVASNVDMEGRPLALFNGVGFFLDPRLPPNLQSSDRVSPTPNFGLVPMVDWRQVGWAPAGSKARDASFLNYRPLAVLQPWTFYDGVWSLIDRRLFATGAKRLIILTGPILTPEERQRNQPVIPGSYWKAAIHWDATLGAPIVETYYANTGTRITDRTLSEAITNLPTIANATGLNFGTATNLKSQAVVTPETPTVYLQFAVMPRREAVEISRRLAEMGYILPPEELVETAAGKAEVRYVREEDGDKAMKLARQTEKLLSELGFGDIKVTVHRLTWVKKQPPPGVLELWVGLRPPVRREAAL